MRTRDLEQARRLELGLAGVRWFGVAFALFQVWQSESAKPVPPASATPRGYALAVLLLIGNLLINLMTRRATRLDRLRLIGLAAFALDMGVIIGMIWNYSYYVNSSSWVIAYILPLEGAIRYQLRGALSATAVFAVSECFRQWYLSETSSHYPFQFSYVSFRVGVGTIIALVAGFMARSLAREAGKANDRALLAEESAKREAAARRELDLFHSAVLAGVEAEELEDSMQSMAETIGRELGFEICMIMLLDEEEVLRPIGVSGLRDEVRERFFRPGEGLTGSVAALGKPLMVRDVRSLTDYVELDRRVQAEAAVPLKVKGEVIGVLDVETWGSFATPEATLDLLSRLADQIALVVYSARLSARQKEMLQRMAELDRMKSDFVAITSHELRTPLTAIRGFVKTMMRNSDRLSAADMQDFLQIVDRQSHRLARLVEDLLMASRIEAGELTIAPEAVVPVSFLGNLLASFGANADRIKLRMEGDTPEAIVIDPYRLEQVLRNLLHNAMKFSPPKSPIMLGVSFDDHQVAMSVADRGIGIAPEEQTAVFERFHQAESADTRNAEGAGLGLYITKRLVEAMGGTIELQSALGRGTTFTVRLPLGDLGDMALVELGVHQPEDPADS